MNLDNLLVEPEGWQLMAFSHHSDGSWYCCFRSPNNAAAFAYANTAQKAWDQAKAKANG